MNTLHRKNNLAKNLYRMQDQDPDSYDFFPRTFLLPHDSIRLKNYYQEIRKQGILKTFIVKPEANCQGRGIFLTQDINCTIFKYNRQKYFNMSIAQYRNMCPTLCCTRDSNLTLGFMLWLQVVIHFEYISIIKDQSGLLHKSINFHQMTIWMICACISLTMQSTRIVLNMSLMILQRI